ncbi:glycosyltransferase [Mesonia ostreae]|uniref:Glycosyltransferase n=1 Tax=Mesonia ostreae TaxID=861110 RepID=A0ABU2KGN9_9FLAO|nr:glycosyltransferase [Mesonia ostreae]MDT0293877.1 glycosyltransferase [Mesonia ostreae]
MKYKFLIYISYSYALPTGNPLEQEILKRGEEVWWFADEKDGKKALKGKDNVYTDIEDVIAYEPHIVLAATNMVPDFITGVKVQIFHGFLAQKRPSKRHLFSEFRIRGFFDLYCTQGPSTTENFKKLAKKYGYFEVVETGWSKVDPLFPIETKEIAAIPNILIASTFTERLSLAYNEEVFQEIKRLSTTGNYNFLMVLHPKLPAEIIKKWKQLEGEFFTYYDTTNLIPLFKKSAILFADTTSAIQEFSLQHKPIVCFDHTFEHDYLIHVHNANKIEASFQYALEYPEKVLKKLATFTQRLHPYHDGLSSARVIDASICFLNKDKTELKPKPINLIRKLKIRQQLHYFTFQTFNRPPVYKKEILDLEKITAIIPTGNEVHNIENVIKSVDFADEILVVDSYSTDGTYEKALQLADKVVRRQYEYSASQKNWAIPQAKHEWVLLVDADERVTVPLREEIRAILANPPKDNTVGYWIGRKNHFMGQHVKHSGWKNDKVIRLFKRDYCVYENKKVHAEIIADGKIRYLKNKFYHNTYITLDKYLEKMNRYAWWQARDYHKKTGELTAYHFVIKPCWSFFKHYILQAGFRDGVVGFTIAYIKSYTVVMRYSKVWLLRRGRK